MAAPLNLNAYFKRIGYRENQHPNLKTLHKLQRLHTHCIAFENLNSFLNTPVEIDLESLQQKLIFDGRGGYCFEQNLLFKSVLEALGFSVIGLSARVLWQQPTNKITRRSHMLLLVGCEKKNYLVDVGFGALTPTAPLLVEATTEQSTPLEPFRLIKREAGFYFLQAEVRGQWRTLYRFNLEQEFMPDYEMANWYLSHHPKSHFVTRLIVTRPDINRRYTLNNKKFKVHHLNGKTEQRELSTTNELINVLETTFKLTLPPIPQFAEALKRQLSLD